MTGLLIKIKHRFPQLWQAVEWANGKAMRLRYPRLADIAATKANAAAFGGYTFKLLQGDSDMTGLHNFLTSLSDDTLRYFNPHDFSLPALRRMARSGSFVMIGISKGTELVGYHFLRCFANGRCFHGLVVSPEERGAGIGSAMWALGATIADGCGLQMYATISEHNTPSLCSCARGCDITVTDRLPDSYLLIRCIPKAPVE